MMSITQSASYPWNGRAMLEHAVKVILKQPTDGPLSRALAHGGIHTILDILTLLQLAWDALTYQDDYGIVKPILISHKNQLWVFKIFATYHEEEGSPIVDWTAINKKDFDAFRCSRAGMHATKMDDAIAPVTISIIASKYSPSMASVAIPKSSSSTVSITASKSSSSTVSVTTSKSSSYMNSSDDTEDRDVLAYSNGKAALHHVLLEVLGQP